MLSNSSTTTLKSIVREGLKNLQEQGVRSVPVDDQARGILHSWSVSPPAAPSRGEPRELESPEQKIDYLRRRAANWSAARRLGSLREKMVFSVGDVHARLVLVGEAPGYDEERLGEPFVGRAGQKLNEILRAMGLRREQIYITNICKFRPSMGAGRDCRMPPSRACGAARDSSCLRGVSRRYGGAWSFGRGRERGVSARHLASACG